MVSAVVALFEYLKVLYVFRNDITSKCEKLMQFQRLLVSIFLAMSSVYVSGCATNSVAPTTVIETNPDAVTVPYRLSSAGRIIIDVAVNETEPQPFVLDTGASVSVFYNNFVEDIGLTPTGDTVLIRGLVAVGRRPVIEDIDFDIGGKQFSSARAVTLEAPSVSDNSVGLLGSDILSNSLLLINREKMVATLIPSQAIKPKIFSGWLRMSLKGNTKGREDIGLHFAETDFGDKRIPVLIDTGSNTNFMNWSMATLDKSIKRLERRMRSEGVLQGALETTPLRLNTKLFGLSLGEKYWPELDVTVIELESLSTIAPVDRPMMIAGAGMFTPQTFAFDFGRNQIYIRPSENEVSAPRQETVLPQAGRLEIN